ncbi:hypothetical protein M6B38_307725 [Iris pallida]|uniref:Uncharacterized protein n=1 Tax=Iris pallida TaxID=29817 RepID=A0AAX6HJQ4_IRIPA|nr:hypothetical protein M6B38_307725 [Iris pallida]
MKVAPPPRWRRPTPRHSGTSPWLSSAVRILLRRQTTEISALSRSLLCCSIDRIEEDWLIKLIWFLIDQLLDRLKTVGCTHKIRSVRI